MVHFSETCDDDTPHLITHVHTTAATVHEAQCTAVIHQGLVEKKLPPDERLVDSAYVDAELLVRSQREHSINLVGPTRANNSWQAKTEGAYTVDQFMVDWENHRCGVHKASSPHPGRSALTIQACPTLRLSFQTKSATPVQRVLYVRARRQEHNG